MLLLCKKVFLASTQRKGVRVQSSAAVNYPVTIQFQSGLAWSVVRWVVLPCSLKIM